MLCCLIGSNSIRLPGRITNIYVTTSLFLHKFIEIIFYLNCLWTETRGGESDIGKDNIIIVSYIICRSKI